MSLLPKIIKKDDGTVLIERFTPMMRFEHTLTIVTFLILVLTGFPQKFYEANWSSTLLHAFGGLDKARYIHRVTGFIFSIHAFLHIGAFIVGRILKRVRLSMVPTAKDFTDVIETLKYYFGKNKEHPKYEKFDYRQKFEYLGLVLGGMVMILSGLILLFPSYVANISGQLIPAARLAHSNEALLAFCVLVVWHIYGAILSPDVFPLDTSIFTGYMTKEELKKHHELEYERIFPEENK